MNLIEYAALAQIVMAAIAVIGIIVSIFFSMKTLREIRLDRCIRSMPHLAFETGGIRLSVEFVKAGKACPGINPKFVETMFPDLPKDAESIRLKIRSYGHLKNYGPGTALDTEILWVPQKIWIGSESFTLDKDKLSEPPYSESLNVMPSCPSHILPEQEASLSRLPTFIEKDHEKKITRVDGILEISCKDIFGVRHATNQQIHLFTGYRDNPPYVHVTLSDLIRCDK